MNIIELPSIPRERGALQSLINDARHAQKRRKLMQWAGINCGAWALIIAVAWPAMHAPQRPHVTRHAYLPRIARLK